MKNIHKINNNIYITNDEQAKEGNWGYIPFQGGNVKLVGKYFADDWKKIILTTDQDLIKDGVQAIDDEFLEWFVKNPSCEEVEVTKVDTFKKTNEVYVDEITKGNYFEIVKQYKIIIPQEEPKQETLEEVAEKLSKDAYKKHSVKDDTLSLDEQIQRSGGFIVGFKEGLKEGAKWQQDNSVKKYTEEDMLKCWNTAFTDAMNIDSETYKPIFYSDFINSLNKQD
jgi:hypothetical protein